MPRVGAEVVTAIDRLLDREPRVDVELILPRTVTAPVVRNIRIQRAGNRGGAAWEQVVFPLASHGKISLNMMGTASVLDGRGCVVVHDAQFITQAKLYGWKARLLYSVITPIVVRRQGRVVTVSNFSRTEIEQRIAKRLDIMVIYNGCDHADRWGRDDSILRQFQLRRGEYILAQATAAGHKNIRVLFAAVQNNPDLAGRLVLFGAGPDTFRSAGIEPPTHVRFLGAASDAQLRSLFENAAVFAYPSLTEGFGLPPLEAMRCGCPVIVSMAGAMPEICGEAALYADPLDAQEWFRTLRHVLYDHGIQQDRRRAGRLRAQQFSWDTAARAYLDVVMELAQA